VGARGYSGLELCRILLKHPAIQLGPCFATSADWKLSDFLPEASNVPVLPMSELNNACEKVDVVFLATPAEVSMKLAPALIQAGKKVVDLSGAYRLEADAFNKWYGHAHESADLLPSASYGLVPWAKPMPSGAGLVANPGCYATAILMGLIPVLRAGAIDASTLVIDAKSGASGAGRKAAENLLFTEVDGECLPYRVGRHQHLPEVQRYLAQWGGVEVDPIFVTSLLPVRRGIVAGMYARLSPAWAKLDDAAAEAKLSQAFNEAYGDYPLVQHAAGEKPAMLSLKRVAGSARTQISYVVKGGKLHLFSLIDNLVKGAAGQAVENVNRWLDLPAHAGLLDREGLL
jgi:N-acetyl-gamma-glutamyl-phosphate reductase